MNKIPSFNCYYRKGEGFSLNREYKRTTIAVDGRIGRLGRTILFISQTVESLNLRKKPSNQCLKVPGATILKKDFLNQAIKAIKAVSVPMMIAKSEKMKMKKSHCH